MLGPMPSSYKFGTLDRAKLAPLVNSVNGAFPQSQRREDQLNKVEMEFRCSVNIAGPLFDSGVGEKEQINIPSSCSPRYVGFQLTCQIAQINNFCS